MSYIRSGSNPEKLYVWGDRKNVYWTGGGLPYDDFMVMSLKDFDSLMREADREGDWYDGISFNNGTLSVHEEFKTLLLYKRWRLEMYDVTFEYILNDWNKRRAIYHLRSIWYMFTTWITTICCFYRRWK